VRRSEDPRCGREQGIVKPRLFRRSSLERSERVTLPSKDCNRKKESEPKGESGDVAEPTGAKNLHQQKGIGLLREGRHGVTGCHLRLKF